MVSDATHRIAAQPTDPEPLTIDVAVDLHIAEARREPLTPSTIREPIHLIGLDGDGSATLTSNGAQAITIGMTTESLLS